MTTQEREAILEGTKAAQRLHADLGTRRAVEAGEASQVDVFATADELGAVLLFRRLTGLLGAYLAEPVSPIPGIIVSTERDLHVQRFTAAHELGHFYLRHAPSLDEDVGLWRSAARDVKELAADAFASEFLLPRWLYVYHARRHRWDTAALQLPLNTYQLSLRLGASYDAVCWGLQSHKILRSTVALKLRSVEPKQLKLASLAGRARLDNPWANVWVVTEADDGLTFEGTPDDLVVFKFSERASAGYLWDVAQLTQQGFELLVDERDEGDDDECGSEVARVLIARVREARQYRASLTERRPWMPSDTGSVVSMAFEMYGKQEGLPRQVRRTMTAT